MVNHVNIANSNLLIQIVYLRGWVLINNISNEDYRVRADPVRLKQVILNLLSNAIKYNREQGKIILESKLLNNQLLQISVTDTGVGLSSEDLTKIFTPFTRLTNTDNEEKVQGLV